MRCRSALWAAAAAAAGVRRRRRVAVAAVAIAAAADYDDCGDCSVGGEALIASVQGGLEREIKEH